jgi:hypothetical protein
VCLLCVAAIQALVSLNEQISTSLVSSDTEQQADFQHRSPHHPQDGGSVASHEQQAFDSSVALMRRLLVDAQVTVLLISFVRLYGTLKKGLKYERDTSQGKIRCFLRQLSCVTTI